ncbi:hypothetical protein [Streptomyces abikoensis]|uniref:PD-(D/E)XK endonuclease-like domain-containing protein n=1 Tax=Streptomyces abikoensis TaxID=97398 RepID=A0ABW7TGL6_9ACTN|nr:hypothetical protein [Streptomyces abikoensis]GGP55558.1 hypothetical protein GCM10010214_30940 [Streptomyces abikoensis]
MTSPRHARDTERGRYYSDPAGGPDLVSVTNVLGTGVAKPALVPWAVKLTAEHCVDNRLDVARRAVKDRDALLKEIKGVHRGARDRASDLGTRVHDRAEKMALRAPFEADVQVDPYARQLALFWERWSVDLDRHIVAAEITFVHRRLGYAGTGDCMLWLPTGPRRRRELWLIDYKTSATRPASSVYPEHALQLAALRYAEAVLLPDDTDGAVPRIERTGVLNLRQRSHALVPMPAGRAAHRAFRGALETTRWLHAAPSAYPALLPPAADARPTRKAA